MVELGTAAGAAHVIDIDTVEAPIALCTSAGRLRGVTPLARELLRRLSIADQAPGFLPEDLWRLLERTPTGEAVEWRPPGARDDVLGCTRYVAASGSYLLLMREVSAKHVALAERLQRQRLEATERLVASIARDLRGSVASVVYSANFLESSGSTVTREVLVETLHDICEASQSLKLTVDALLDYARLGPSVSVPVPLRDVLDRVQAFLRAHYRDGAHRLRVDVAPHAEWVRGNPIVIEQIFINLLLNSVESSPGPRCVALTAFPAPLPGRSASDGQSYVCVRVWDDGPGIPSNLREFIFDPFFTTKQQRTGLGLAMARQAAESLEGTLILTDDQSGTCFAVYLPGCQGAQ